LGLSLTDGLAQLALAQGSTPDVVARQNSLRHAVSVEQFAEGAVAYRTQLEDAELEATAPPHPDDFPEPVNVGEEHPEETDAALEAAVVEAQAQGLPPELVPQWRDALFSSAIRPFWRSKLGSDPPARVDPMVARLKPGSTPMRTKTRTYSPVKEAWLSAFLCMLVTFGLLFANPQALWSSCCRWRLVQRKLTGKKLICLYKC
jgi:hypothetical protein